MSRYCRREEKLGGMKYFFAFLWVIIITINRTKLSYITYSHNYICGWGAKKTSRQPQDRRAQERRCKRIFRG